MTASPINPNNCDPAEMITFNLERWCFAVRNYPGEIYPKLIYKVIKHMAQTLREAIELDLIVNLVALGQRLAADGKFVVSEHDVVVALTAALPSPASVDKAHHLTLAQTLGLVEQVIPENLKNIKEHWELERLRKPAFDLERIAAQ